MASQKIKKEKHELKHKEKTKNIKKANKTFQ